MMKLWILVFLFLLPQLYCINSYQDTINFNNPLKDDGSLIVSGDGTFALGFFSPGKSTNRYLGIWYNKIRQQTVVWVANRDTPLLHNSSGVLSIHKTTGNLFLSAANLSTTTVWSTNVSTSTSGNQFLCRLSDSGNLELLHDETVVWQSFDHPTNTMISLMKLGLDKRRNLNRFITSWKSRDDPETGEFMLRLDDTELPEMIFQQGRSKRLWRTGPWIGGGWVGIPQMSTNSFFLNISFVNDPNEVYLMYTVNDVSILSTMVVNESGVLQRLAWHDADNQWSAFWTFPVDECEYYGKCGANGYCDPQITEEFECTCLPGFEPAVPRDWFLRDGSAGCVRKKEQAQTAAAAAECGKGDGFFKLVKAKLPATGVARVHKSIVGVDACGEECLKNCTCTAYASGGADDDGGECITWHGELVDTRVFTNGGWDLYVRINGVELAKLYSSSRKARSKKVAYIASSVCAVIIVGVLILCSVLIINRRRARKRKEGEICFTSGNISTVEGSTKDEKLFDEVTIDGNLNLFDFNTIVKATNNFSISNTLGEGGFGVVYKGHLRNGKTIAVKRLAKNSDQGVDEFKNEVSLIVKLQHMNLVRLLGCCVQQQEKMLIYEYLPNKSLDSFIFDKEKSSQLDWEKRFTIILGIARGMIYIHQDSRLRIVHRDLKASNILLDDEMNPKISDFGMARIFGRNQMEANTKRVVGTYGYMSPEYAMGGIFSTKSDVFSFGVLLLEIISGRKNSSYFEDEAFNLIGYTWRLWKEEKSLEIIDSVLSGSFNYEEALRCVHIGLLCVQEFPSDRPTMSDVAFMLCNEVPMPCPNQPAFIFNDRIKNVLDSSSGSTGANSNNGLSITQINAR